VTPFDLFLIVLLGLTAGVMIGCIGVGGVILVPSLLFFIGIPVHTAIPAAMMAYILSGIVGTTVYARNKSINWPMAGWLCAGATPTAFAGAWMVHFVDARLLELGIGLLTLLSGANALRAGKQAIVQERTNVSKPSLVMVGALTGFVSAISGTGGPLILVPVLISLSLPVLVVVGLSQAIQLPVAVAATFGNLLYGKLDLALGAALAFTLIFGSWSGAKLAHVVPRATIRRFVSFVLVLIGIFILFNVTRRLLS
jgi:uncharacterized membrane protein YfcA